MLIRTFLAACALATPVFAQEPVQRDDIVVVAPAIDERIRGFVGETSQEMTTEDQLARWDRRICPSVIGLTRREQAQFLIDHITQRAADIGIEVGAPDCRPNALIFVTADSDALARTIVSEYRALTGYNAGQNAVTQGRDALTVFAETPLPVRWWHVSQTVTADGQVLADTVAMRDDDKGMRGVQVTRTTAPAGRLNASTRQDFNRVIIIVDADAAAGVQLFSLADYLAMVTLAQVSPDADLAAAPSILDLFTDPPGPTALTEWDLAYLEGLYGARRNATSAQAQQRDIVRSMEERLEQ